MAVREAGSTSETARVVVIGGGVMGASVLYHLAHLAHLGWRDCGLVETAKFTPAPPGTRPDW